MDTLTNVITIVWALRWVLTAIAFAALGALYAESLHDRRRLRDRVDQLELRNRVLVAVRAGSVRGARRRPPIIASRRLS